MRGIVAIDVNSVLGRVDDVVYLVAYYLPDLAAPCFGVYLVGFLYINCYL